MHLSPGPDHGPGQWWTARPPSSTRRAGQLRKMLSLKTGSVRRWQRLFPVHSCLSTPPVTASSPEVWAVDAYVARQDFSDFSRAISIAACSSRHLCVFYGELCPSPGGGAVRLSPSIAFCGKRAETLREGGRSERVARCTADACSRAVFIQKGARERRDPQASLRWSSLRQRSI